MTADETGPTSNTDTGTVAGREGEWLVSRRHIIDGYYGDGPGGADAKEMTVSVFFIGYVVTCTALGASLA